MRTAIRRAEALRRNRRLFLGWEPLEGRQMLTIVASVSLGVLTMTGDGANDRAVIESNAPGSVDIDYGSGFGATNFTGIDQVIFNGNGGDDELVIIQKNSGSFPATNIFVPTGGIQFNGGGNNDTLTMAGGTVGTFSSGTYTSTGASSGEVRYDVPGATDVVVTFSAVELVNDTTTANAFNAVTGGGNDTMVIEPGPTLPPVGGITQGPVFIDGGDRDDHGNFSGGANINGWKFMQQGMQFVRTGTFNGAANDIVAIGVSPGQARNAIQSVATALGYNITYVTGAANIAAVNLNLYKVMYVPSNSDNVVGGITAAEENALAGRVADIQSFVRNGGGIVALTDADSGASGGPYAWLEIPDAFTIFDYTAGGITRPLRLTPEGTAAFTSVGLTPISNTELSAGVPYHNVFTGPAGFNGLDVFVRDTGPNGIVGDGDDEIVTLGQGPINTVIGGGATLKISGSLTTMNVGQKTSLDANTGLGNDSLTLDGSVVSLDVIGIPLNLNAGGGTDTVTITDAADPNGDTVAITPTQVTGLRTLPIPYVGAESLIVGTTQGNDLINVDFTALNSTTNVTVNAFAGDDTFGTLPSNRIKPSLYTTLTLNGGNPVVLPGDRLNLDMAGTTAPIFVDTVGGQALSQSHLPVFFSSIETYDVIDESGPIPNVDQGDLYVRTTPLADFIVFSKGSGLSTRVRVNNAMYTFFPNNQIICYGREADDFITASNVTLPADFRGEDGVDYITGGTANDWLVGGLGADRINGSSGDNIIWGDNSPLPSDPQPQDLAIGGDDTLSGLGGADVFYGGGGNDVVSGGAGNDYINGGMGNDTLDGNDGDDRIYGGAGNDILSGYSGNDYLGGGGNDDRLYGQAGADVLVGGTGADLVDGGDGNDLLISGSVLNESSSWTSLANTSTFPAANYVNPADNDAQLLIVLALWGSTSTRSGALGSISHDLANDDLFGSLGDDDFCWEAADIADNVPAVAPVDYLALGMGADERFGPT